MLEIVCQSRGFGRVVLAAHAHCNGSLYARSGLIDTHIDLETVFKSVNAGAAEVTPDGLVLVPATGRQHCTGQHCKDK